MKLPNDDLAKDLKDLMNDAFLAASDITKNKTPTDMIYTLRDSLMIDLSIYITNRDMKVFNHAYNLGKLENDDRV